MAREISGKPLTGARIGWLYVLEEEVHIAEQKVSRGLVEIQKRPRIGRSHVIENDGQNKKWLGFAHDGLCQISWKSARALPSVLSAKRHRKRGWGIEYIGSDRDADSLHFLMHLSWTGHFHNGVTIGPVRQPCNLAVQLLNKADELAEQLQKNRVETCLINSKVNAVKNLAALIHEEGL